MKKVPLLRLEYSDDDIRFIVGKIKKVLRSNYLTMAGNVLDFERKFALYCGTRYALGTNSGTSALEMILRSIDVTGKTVVMPSNTYMATPLAAIKAGARVIFADCEFDNLQMDPDDLGRKIRSDTAAVIIVHIGGIISPRINEIVQICKKSGIPLVEDAAHAHGATYKGRFAGNLGVAGAFSFYPTKVLTTAEGGMVTTNKLSLLKKMVVLREHGKADHRFNVHTEIGDNWRFSELHAVLGLQQMKRVKSILRERREIAALYDRLLESVPEIEKITLPSSVQSAYYKYIVYLPRSIHRDPLKTMLKKRFGVQLTGEVYSDPCHSQPVFKKYPATIANQKGDKFPNTNEVCKRQICLPLYPGLKPDEVSYVVKCLKKALLLVRRK